MDCPCISEVKDLVFQSTTSIGTVQAHSKDGLKQDGGQSQSRNGGGRQTKGRKRKRVRSGCYE